MVPWYHTFYSFANICSAFYKNESCSQDSPPAAGRFSVTLPLCRSAIPRSVFCVIGRSFLWHKKKGWVCVFPLQTQPVLLILCLFTSVYAILTIELINTSTSCSSFLLASVEWMALGANLNVDLWLCRACYELVTAVAGNLCLIVCWMDSFSHDFHLSSYFLLIVTRKPLFIIISSLHSIA